MVGGLFLRDPILEDLDGAAGELQRLAPAESGGTGAEDLGQQTAEFAFGERASNLTVGQLCGASVIGEELIVFAALRDANLEGENIFELPAKTADIVRPTDGFGADKVGEVVGIGERPGSGLVKELGLGG